jgi:hypothetical protein
MLPGGDYFRDIVSIKRGISLEGHKDGKAERARSRELAATEFLVRL